MTGSELLAYCKKNFKRTDKDSELYECMTDTIVDMRLRMLSQDHQQEAYVTGITTLGDYRLAVPSDFGHLIGSITFVDTSSDQTYPPLKKISKETYDEMNYQRLASSVGNQLTGVPSHFCIYAEQVYLYPVPDILTYRYYMNYTTEDVTEITSSTDPVPFTDHYRRIVRDGVLMMIYRQLENFGESDKYEIDYERGIRKIIDNEDMNQDDNCNMVYNGS